MPERGVHAVHFYEGDDFLAEEVADFLDEALRAGDVALMIATPEHRAAIKRRLQGLGARKGMAAWYTGELVEFDAAETLACILRDGRPDEQLFAQVVGEAVARASQGGSRAVHAFGEMVALLCEQGRHREAIELEALWNGLGERLRFSLLCAYPTRLFADGDPRGVFRAVCAAHDHIRPVCGQASLEAEVTKRRQAELLLRRREKELADFLENAAEGLHRVGPDGTILWANKAELELLGYAAHEYVGRNIVDFHADRAAIEQMLDRLRTGETLYDQPATLRCKDGSLKHVRIHTNAYIEDGGLVYTRCFTRDVTEQMRLLDELQQANRAKDEFLAMLGHELRNPLAPIVTALQLMKMRGDTHTQREQQVIARQVDHLMRLVDDLLDVSRIARGRIELRKEPVEIADVLAKAVEMASPLFEQHRHRLVLDVKPEGLRCEGDPVRLAQVVANLLTNAARYTPPGGDIELAAARMGGDIAIRVKDNGIGIAAEMLPRVFDLFFQGQRSSERASNGLGLGLALVKNLVEQHGGSVVAHSDGPQRGSEFTVRLPALAEPTGGEDAAGRSAAAPGTVHGTGSLRVLLVDDNVDAAEMLAHLLSAAGHEVRIAHDGITALGMLERFVPQVALLDIGLPAMDGYELGLQLRHRLAGAACRLIALTGYGQASDRRRSEQAGFEAHLVKPIDPERLLALVSQPAPDAPADRPARGRRQNRDRRH
jgi:PAS domain S-box-containing protein